MSRAWRVRVDPDAPLAGNARQILGVRMAELYSYAPVVPYEQAKRELHDMRIAAKRLRYTLELFRNVFGDLGERQIERVKAIQEALGDLHDTDERIALIEAQLTTVAIEEVAAAKGGLDATVAAHEADPRPGLLALLGRQAAARRAQYQTFVALWTRLNAAGLRADLAALSSLPLSETPDRAPQYVTPATGQQPAPAAATAVPPEPEDASPEPRLVFPSQMPIVDITEEAD